MTIDMKSSGYPLLSAEDEHSLSFNQEDLIARSTYLSEKLIANNAVLIRLQDVYVVPSLMQTACDCLVEWHPTLHTTYSFTAPNTFFAQARNAGCDFRAEDASQWDNHTLEMKIEQDIREEFALEQGSVFRVRTYSRGKNDCRILLCAHPLAADPRSFITLVQDLKDILSDLHDAHSRRLAGPKRNYLDWVRDERARWMNTGTRNILVEQRRALAQQASQLDLPIDHQPDPQNRPHRVRELRFNLAPELGSNLALVAEAQNVTLSSIYLAAYAVLLSRHANTSEVVIGTAEVRNGSSTGIVGDFSNVVPVLLACNPEQSFCELLSSTDRTLGELQHNQQIPISLLESAPEKRIGLAVETTTRACFSWENWDLGDETVELIEWKTQSLVHTSYDLALQIQVVKGTVRPALLYRTDLFEADTVLRLARRLVRLLEQVAVKPGLSLDDLEILPDDERALVLSLNASGRADFPRLCLHELFTAQAELQADREALVFGADRLSYRQLDEQSNQVAQFLCKKGLCPGDHVGIFMDRSAGMIVAMLGILKAGGAYVPIDPAYPQERLEFIAKDTAVHWVLTERTVKTRLPVSAALIYIDDPSSPLHACSKDPVGNRSTPESVAAVIYTSGSTGQPKAALIPHRAVIRTVCNTNHVDATREDRVAQVASPSFDAALMEIWLALANGGTLIGMRRETLLDPAALSELVRAERISILVLNTAYVHQIGRDMPQVLQGVRKILFGGESAEPGPLRRLLDYVQPGALVNGYGPAEGCVISTYYEIASLPADAATVPIGRNVTNAQIYLLDEGRRPVPIGVKGEIYIGGEGVALGYWNRPDLNAQRFLPDPFSAIPGRLLYRTGDMARMRPDGELEFHGRMDEQVKIRGHRIELAEVRQAITTHPNVEQVYLMVREDQPGDKRLVAYATLHRPDESASETLRQHVRQKLPAHMQPAVFVVLETLPLNTNGKVDRKALPAPSERADFTSKYHAPQGELEQLLARAWQDLLGVDQVGSNDNFFDLGGHSLLATRLLARVEKDTGQQLPITALFEAPTVAQFARKLLGEGGPSAWAPMIPLSTPSAVSGNPLFCINWQGTNLVTFRRIASHLRGDRALFGVQPKGLDLSGRALATVEELASAYTAEIRKQQPEGPYNLTGICIGGVLAFEIAQQLRSAGQEVEFLLLIDTYCPGEVKHLHTRSNFTQYMDDHLGELLLLPFGARLRYIANWLRNGIVRLGRTFGVREPESVASQRRAAEASTSAVLAYTPQPYSGKVVHFLCSDGPHRSYEDRRLAWSDVAEGGLEIHIVPGSHFTWVEEPNLAVFANKLRACLQKVQGTAPKNERNLGAESTGWAKPLQVERSRRRKISRFVRGMPLST